MRLFITPADVWMFRGGLPFGEDATITSEFPPTPETLQGALRSLIAAQWSGNLSEAFGDGGLTTLIGDRSGYGRFRLHGYSLGMYTTPDNPKNVVRLFPLPAHLLANKHSEDGSTHQVYFPKQENGVRANYPDDTQQWPLCVSGGVDIKSDAGDSDVRWVDAETLKSLLSSPGAQPLSKPMLGYTDGDLFDREMRPGIGMDRAKRTTSEGIFFRTEMIRPRNEAHFQVGLVADIHLAANGDQPETVYNREALQQMLRLRDTGWMTIGGERRPATYEVICDGDAPPTGGSNQPGGERTLLYFATPAYFNGGWRPVKIDENKRPVKDEHGDDVPDWKRMFGATPIAAAIPRQQLIGGWQLTPGKAGGNATANSKVLRRCVPAGSVLFFDEPPSQPGPYSDYGKEIGFGLTIQGAW